MDRHYDGPSFDPSPSSDDHPSASVAASRHPLEMGVAAWTDSPDEASTDTLSDGGEPPARNRDASISIYQNRRRSNNASASWWRVSLFAYVYSTAFAMGDPCRQQLHITGREGIFPPCFVGDTRRCREDSSGRSHLGRLRSSDYSQNEIRIRNPASNTASNVPTEAEREFFISDAQVVHLSPAARILTEEFYSHKTNFITFQIERLKTVLSLESTFPNQQNSLRKEYSRRTLQRMIVACDAKNGQVVGFAEVDARPLGINKNGGSKNESLLREDASDDILRSYMYNLAVDKRWKRKGIASALVTVCEQFVSDMHGLCVEKRLYLRVRKSNHAAIALYESLGYREMLPEAIQLSREDINSGSLEDGELLLFAKDLPIGGECPLD